MKHFFMLFTILALVASVGFAQIDQSLARDEANVQGVQDANGNEPPKPVGDGSRLHLVTPLAVLFDNGPLVTHPGGGSGGADASALQNTVLNSYGANQNGTTYRIADDFTVAGGAWTIDSIAFFGYQTGSSTTSTFTAVRVEIWNGPPNEPGSSVVFGDLTTNRMISTRWSNIYRVLITTLTATDRPIMRNVASVGTMLLPGTYWLVWNATGSLASGPWQPPVSILGTYITGNARQWTGAAWQAMRDSIAPNPGNPQGVPFIIYGTGSSNPLNPFNLQTPAAGAKITTLAGSTTPVTITWDTSTATATYKWIFGSPTVPPRLFTLPSATNTLTTTLGALDALLAAGGVVQGDSLNGQWDVWAFRNNPPANDSLKSTNGPRTVTLKRGRPALAAFSLVSPPTGTTIVTSSVVTTPITFVWNKSGDGATYRWKFATPTFAGTIRFNVPTALDTFAMFRSSQLDSLVAGLGVNAGDSIAGQWRAYAYSGTDSLASTQTFNVTLKRAVPPTTFTLLANPGPSNNGGATGYAIFFNLIAGPRQVTLTEMTTGNTGAANASFTVQFYTRTGNALGGPVGSGPGSSSAGWTSVGTVPVTQGSVANGVSLLFATPNITINPGDTAGVAMLFTGAGPRYFGTGTPAYSTYSDANLTLVTGDSRSAPFTPTGSFFASRALVGELHYSTPTVGVEEYGQEIPATFDLLQNYPNPFNPTTTIQYGLPTAANVTLKIYNVLGQEIITLYDGQREAGRFQVAWNGRNAFGTEVASGMYFYSIAATSANDKTTYTNIKKMLFLK